MHMSSVKGYTFSFIRLANMHHASCRLHAGLLTSKQNLFGEVFHFEMPLQLIDIMAVVVT